MFTKSADMIFKENCAGSVGSMLIFWGYFDENKYMVGFDNKKYNLFKIIFHVIKAEKNSFPTN